MGIGVRSVRVIGVNDNLLGAVDQQSTGGRKRRRGRHVRRERERRNGTRVELRAGLQP